MRYLRPLIPILIALALLSAAGLLLAYDYEVLDWTWSTTDPGAECQGYNGSGDCNAWHSDMRTVYVTFTPIVTATGVTAVFEYHGGDFELTAYNCDPQGYVVYGGAGDWTWYTWTVASTACPTPVILRWQPHGGAEQWVRNLSVHYTSDIPPEPPVGGWPACTTVSNPDFDSSASWTLQGGASLITSVLNLPAIGASASQDFQIVSNFYTVTVVAMRVSTDSLDSLIVAIAPPEGSTGHTAGTGPIAIPSDGAYHTMTAVVTPDTLGDGALHIVSNGSHKIDYVCLQPAYGENKCTSTSQEFDFQQGYNVDPSFISQGWGFSQNWAAVDYPLQLPPSVGQGKAIWACSSLGECGFSPAALLSLVGAQATIRYAYMIVPQVITVHATIGGYGTFAHVLTSQDGQTWTDAQTQPITDTATPAIFNLNYDAPVYVAIAVIFADPISGLSRIDQVEITGCFAGPNTFAGCIVGDSDFDTSDGYPSRFYWDGAYQSAAGAAVLQQDGFIAQALTPPWAGDYSLSVTGSSIDQSCLWRVMFSNYGSGVPIASVDVPCTQGNGATYSRKFSLTTDPVMLWIKQVGGNSSISRVCLAPASGNLTCLNENPDFTDGPAGYATQNSGHVPMVQSGAAILGKNYNLYAWNVNYPGMSGPYMLQVTASPVVSTAQPQLFITSGDIPTPDDTDGVIITGTRTLTYEFASPLPAGNGPMIWNAYGPDGENEGALVTWYCITRSATISQYIPPTDPYSCTTVTNPSFTAGLDNWTANADVLATNGVASFAGGGQLSQALGSFDVTTATVRWLTRAYAQTPITLTVASDYGGYTFNHSLVAGGGGFFQETVPISGATSITVTSGSSGLELDFICLYPGSTAPPLITGTITGTVQIPPGGQLAQCVPPPMGILPNNMTSTLASLWPWGTSPTYGEVLAAYNTAWVRYIGCRFDYYVGWLQDEVWGKSLFEEIARGRCILSVAGVSSCGMRGYLEIIISLLALSALLQAVTALAQTVNLIGEGVGEIVKNAVDVGRTLLYLFGLVGLVIAALIGLLVLLAALIWLIWQIPAEFWTSFRNAATGTDVVALPLPTSSDDPLYNIVVGLQLINQVGGATFLYPVVVVSIVVGSIGILLWTIRQFSVKV